MREVRVVHEVNLRRPQLGQIEKNEQKTKTGLGKWDKWCEEDVEGE